MTAEKQSWQLDKCPRRDRLAMQRRGQILPLAVSVFATQNNWSELWPRWGEVEK